MSDEPSSFSPDDQSSASASRVLADRLAAAGEPTGPEEETQSPVEAPVARRPWTGREIVFLLALVGAALLLAGMGYLALTNADRADRWEKRVAVLDRHIDGLNGLLVERSNLLNARTREVNRMATSIERQEAALNRSEADVSSLERRQRQLADEKAKLEDSRARLATQAAALETVAGAFVDCKDGLVELLGYLLQDDFSSASAISDGVFDNCQNAEDELARYEAANP